MMRLVCNGVALDLMSGATLAFNKVNPLFAFDSLTCERTQSFDIPATPKNDAVFELAKLPAFYGSGMRRRFDCELQSGTIVKRGYLYVDEYKNGAYKGVFVTGELFGLLRIKQAGTIAEIVADAAETEWGNPISASLAAAIRPMWRSVKYLQQYPGGVPFPSYSLYGVLKNAMDAIGVPTPTVPDSAKNLRVIPKQLHRIDTTTTIVSEPRENSQSGDPMNALQFDARYFEDASVEYANQMTGTCKSFDGFNELDEPRTVHYLEVAYNATADITRTIKCVRSKFKMAITFPDDESLDGIIVFNKPLKTAPYDLGYRYQQSGPVYSWGFQQEITPTNSDYAMLSWFDAAGVVDTWNKVRKLGMGIRGNTIQVEAGETLAFIHINDLRSEYTYQWRNGATTTARFDFEYEDGHKNYERDGMRGFAISMALLSDEPQVGQTVYLQPNLPELAITDILKTIAYMYGRVLNYNDAQGVTLETLSDIDQWPRLDITGRVIEQDVVTRKFMDYAQRNIVRFDSYANIYTNERVQIAYIIDNDNIAEEKELQKMPFSEGSEGEKQTTHNAVLIRNLSGQNIDKDTLTIAGRSEENLGRVSLIRNAKIQALCDASTSLTIKIHMTLAEYENLHAKTTLLYNGTRYVWSEATWKKDVCTCKISKI